MLKERICLTGISPERALTRFCSQRIAVYDVVKKDVQTLCFSVHRRDARRVYALYPQAKKGRTYAYSTRRLPARGALKCVRFFQNSVGVILGGLLFVLLTYVADQTVMKIVVDAPVVYHAQVHAALKENGINPYAFYQKGKEDLICAKLLSFEGVSYCSIEKSGGVLTVRIKTNSFSGEREQGDFFAERNGKIMRLVVLGGTSTVEVGALVKQGDRLVEGGIYSADGERQSVPVVAYAVLSCEYLCTYDCADEQEAFARAYLEAGLQDSRAEIAACEIEKTGDTCAVKLSYLWTQRMQI